MLIDFIENAVLGFANQWLEDVSAGLMYLHYTHRSVHRDVKSGNILLTDHTRLERSLQTLDWRKWYNVVRNDFKSQRSCRIQCLKPIRRLCGIEERLQYW